MSSSEDELLLLASCAILLKKKEKMKRKKKLWMKSLYEKRNFSTQENLLSELRLQCKEDYSNFMKMDSETFDELLFMVKPLIEKRNTVMRAAITADMRLSATLSYLATGKKMEDLKLMTAISPRSLKLIIVETCEAICKCLSNYIQMPKSNSEWKRIAEDFNSVWNFPNCIGAIGGRHIAIKKPLEESSLYNKRKFFSVVLTVTVNANYEFVFADVGSNARISDGTIKNTNFGKALYSKSLAIPRPSKLPNSDKELPYIFIGDNAFEMKTTILKPYSDTNLTDLEKIFNYRLNRAHRIVENVFGILISRFGVLQTTITSAPDKAQIIVLACCYLHNFLRKKQSYAFNDLIDTEDTSSGDLITGSWRKNKEHKQLEDTQLINFSNKAKQVRDIFAEYFMKEGAVPWQIKFTQ